MSDHDQRSGADGMGGTGGESIVELADFADRSASRTLAALRAYWSGLRRGRAVPERAEIDPRAIERTLEYAFILERIAAGHARFRIAGMHLNDLMGMEVRGMPLAAFFAPEAREQVQTVLEQVFSGPEIAEIALRGEEGFGRPPMQARLLLLPLRSDLGDISRVLGCLVADGRIGRTPRRFIVDSAVVEAVITGAPTGPRVLPDTPADSATARSSTTGSPNPGKPAPMGMNEPPATAPAAPPATAPAAPGSVNPKATPEQRRAMFRVVQ